MMRADNALIGHTGFVGGNLARQAKFEQLYSTSNIADIRGKEFNLLVCSGARAEKWKANLDPATDLAQIENLLGHLETVRAKQVVLISTVDVVSSPIEKDESASLYGESNHAYGRHRLHLERAFAQQFDRLLILRLPGLFGHGLKKNAIFDLLRGHEVHKIDSRNVFQFYSLQWLWRDLSLALELGLDLLHLATEPVSVEEMARDGLGIRFKNELETSPVRYDLRSMHSRFWDRDDGYLYDRSQVMSELRRFALSFLGISSRSSGPSFEARP